MMLFILMILPFIFMVGSMFLWLIFAVSFWYIFLLIPFVWPFWIWYRD